MSAHLPPFSKGAFREMVWRKVGALETGKQPLATFLRYRTI